MSPIADVPWSCPPQETCRPARRLHWGNHQGGLDHAGGGGGGGREREREGGIEGDREGGRKEGREGGRKGSNPSREIELTSFFSKLLLSERPGAEFTLRMPLSAVGEMMKT